MDYLEEVKILATNFTCGEGGNNNKKKTLKAVGRHGNGIIAEQQPK
jgi:hypothetical protein